MVIRFITGSYDRTCKVWDTRTGQEQLSLEGHKSVVYSLAFNKPYGDRIATGSFDKTAKVICLSLDLGLERWKADEDAVRAYDGYRVHSVRPDGPGTRDRYW